MTERSVEIDPRLRKPLKPGAKLLGVKIVSVIRNPYGRKDISWSAARNVDYQVEHQCCGRLGTMKHSSLMNRLSSDRGELCISCGVRAANARKLEMGEISRCATSTRPVAAAVLPMTPEPPALPPLRLHGLSWAGFVDWHAMIVFQHRRSVEVAP